jgi:hypothetical protein
MAAGMCGVGGCSIHGGQEDESKKGMRDEI